MASYQPVYPEIKNAPKKFTSIKAVHKFLTETKTPNLTCKWFEGSTRFALGYREFTLNKDGSLSYSRFPMHDF